MIVTLVSQCEKKAINRTRQILDAYANRIGDNTWQTVITEEGLQSLRTQLRRTATKNTAVACHVIHSRKQTELLWIVGNREKFNELGYVAVNSTVKDINHSNWENDWFYLPVIKALTAVAGLFHDLGKASDAFQLKLKKNQKISDTFRHEWISIVLLSRWISQYKSDEEWLDGLSNIEVIQSFLKNVQLEDFNVDFSKLPDAARIIFWLIVSHHRLPDSENPLEFNREAKDAKEVLNHLTADWGYAGPAYEGRPEEYKTIRLELLKDSSVWLAQVKKWTTKLKSVLPIFEQSLTNGAWRVIVNYSHLCLTLGDHYYSSLPAASRGSQCELIANTLRGCINQRLDEHLLGVTKHAVRVAYHLPYFENEMEFAQDLRVLAKRSLAQYSWQDKAVDLIKKNRKKSQEEKDGYFAVNMASTGKGKTIANAKIMMALSSDQKSLRYVLALGLRTLTLQTGDSYRDDLHLTEDDLAVVIGSNVIQELHDGNSVTDKVEACLFNNELQYTPLEQYEFLDVLFAKNESKYKAFLAKPVLCCTIDHMMPATECVRGGRFILPMMRLMSSDLIIDEIDDFGPQDSLAISRLVYTAGMLGKKVMISSATIPPDLASGLFDAYQAGFKLYSAFKGRDGCSINCMWVDEFCSEIEKVSFSEDVLSQYQDLHHAFVSRRAEKLSKSINKHLAYLVSCESIKTNDDLSDREKRTAYYSLIKDEIVKLHRAHCLVDEETHKRVSFGVIRVANVKPCIELGRYLLNAEYPDCEIRVLVYHSREILLIRNCKEKYLDRVLKRKWSSKEYGLDDRIVREHIRNTGKRNVIFIVVATPVEEVGRDHDFDWAIVEPSSYRSIIQLSGRVLRHRSIEADIDEPNVGLLQYNIKGLLGKQVAFSRPGFEEPPKYLLNTKDLSLLIDWEDGVTKINAIPRIKKKTKLVPNESLADLEHEVIAAKLSDRTSFGAGSLDGWLREAWFMTALPQNLNSFREKNTDIPMYVRPSQDSMEFCEKDDDGNLVPRGEVNGVSFEQLSEKEKSCLWIKISYRKELEKYISESENYEHSMNRCASRFGEILLMNVNERSIYIQDLGLLCGVKKNDEDH